MSSDSVLTPRFQKNACAIEASILTFCESVGCRFQKNACAIEATSSTSAPLCSVSRFRRTLVRLKLCSSYVYDRFGSCFRRTLVRLKRAQFVECESLTKGFRRTLVRLKHHTETITLDIGDPFQKNACAIEADFSFCIWPSRSPVSEERLCD